MVANLAGEEAAPRPVSFPYSNWGPVAAVLGVILALGAGVVMGVPALLFGTEHGSIERYDLATGAARDSIGDEDSSDLAVDRGGTVLADRGTEIDVFRADGSEAPGSPFGEFDASHGIALDPVTGTAYVADERAGTVSVFTAAATAPKLLTQFGAEELAADFEPERLALAPAGQGLYVIDRGSDSVVELSPQGTYLGRLDPAPSPVGEFEFGDAESNDVAVDDSGGPGEGTVYVVAGGDEDGSVLAFDRRGSFLWELPSEGHEFCGAAVDDDGRLWLTEAGGGAAEYAGGRSGRAPSATGRVIDTDSSSCAVAVGGGDLAVARQADRELTTGANIFVQLATALGFLLVPMAIASWRGASGWEEIRRRLGMRSFRPSALKWMAAAIGAYLVFAAVYVAVIGEPHQEDIAKGFGVVPVQVLLIVIAAPISEEVCFRGMLFGGLRERLPRVAAALLSALIFGGLHALTGISAVPPLIVFGFLLALLYEKTGSIVPGILLHMLNNAVALLGQ